MGNYILTMGIFCRENLRTEDVRAKEDGLNLMAATIKEISKITSLMDMESILTSMVINTKANGKTIYLMVRAKPNILMAVDTMANF